MSDERKCEHLTSWPHSAEGVGCLHDHPAPPSPDPGEVERVAQVIAARLGWHGIVVRGEPARDAARAALAALAALRPATDVTPCSWCTRAASGTADRYLDGGERLSSCGLDGHGSAFTPTTSRPATDAEQKVARVEALAEEDDERATAARRLATEAPHAHGRRYFQTMADVAEQSRDRIRAALSDRGNWNKKEEHA